MSKKTEEESGKATCSRRGFLKGGGIAVGSVLLGGLSGCGSSNGTSETKNNTGDPASYKVVDTDILFVGGGIGALTGVVEAIKNGRKVTIIDKGPWRAGGASGYNWDLNTNYVLDEKGFNWFAAQYTDEMTTSKGAINNKELALAAAQAEPLQEAPLFYVGVGGECFPRRKSDGSDFLYDLYMGAPYNIESVDGGFPRHVQDFLTAQPSVTIHDRSMITNVIVNNGRCVGVLALHLPTGTYTVYKANAVIQTAGGCGWWAGWRTVSPEASGSPDNTADVEMALFRRGCGIGDTEFAQYDYTTFYPSGIAGGYNLSIGGDNTHPEMIVDKNSENYWKEYLGNVPFASMAPLVVATAKFMIAHPEKLGPNGGVYIATADPTKNARMRKIYSRNYWIFKERFGIDATKNNVEVGFEMWEHGGTPIVDTNLMTEIKGLFNQRGSGVTGNYGGMVEKYNRRYSSHAVRGAVAYLKSAPAPSTLDFSDAVKEISRLEEIRTRNVSGGQRPHVVRQLIQKAVEKCCGPVRRQADLDYAKAELARIRKEDLPKQTCADTTQAYNIEWKQAIENYNLIDMAELFVGATLERKESRAVIYRPEYPTADDVNFKCALIGRTSGGTISFTKRYLPTVVWNPAAPTAPTIVSAQN